RVAGLQTALRLGFDPVQQPTGTLVRPVLVDRLRRRAKHPVTETLGIGWSGMPNVADEWTRLRHTQNATTITEWAAIGVMALLLHDLEGCVLQTVLPIGSGGDYLILTNGRHPKQVEVSGIDFD